MSDRSRWFDYTDPDPVPELRGYTTADEAFDLWREQRAREDTDEVDYE